MRKLSRRHSPVSISDARTKSIAYSTPSGSMGVASVAIGARSTACLTAA
jgi:hypothetical protein